MGGGGAGDDLPAAPVVRLGGGRKRGGAGARPGSARGGGRPVMESGETIQVEIEEKISAEFERDGNLKSMQIAVSCMQSTDKLLLSSAWHMVVSRIALLCFDRGTNS